jgi:hypothetical protein
MHFWVGTTGKGEEEWYGLKNKKCDIYDENLKFF